MQWCRNELGRSGVLATPLGLGGAGIGGTDVSDFDAVATVELALQSGIDTIDTSPLYSESERRLGIALRGVPRNSYVLSTKTGTHPLRRGDYSRDSTLWSIENSLRLLGTNYLDIAFVHDPEWLEPVFAPDGALETLEQLKSDGVVRAIGLGQRRHDFHRIAVESGRFDVILTFNDYHPLRTTALESGLLDVANNSGVGVVNGSPLGLGLLVADPLDPVAESRHGWQTREWELLARYHEFCRAHGMTPEAVALQFSLRQPRIHCTLTGARSPAELTKNLRAVQQAIPDNVWKLLADARFTEAQI